MTAFFHPEIQPLKEIIVPDSSNLVYQALIDLVVSGHNMNGIEMRH